MLLILVEYPNRQHFLWGLIEADYYQVALGFLRECSNLAEFVDSSKLPLQKIVREGLNILRKVNA